MYSTWHACGIQRAEVINPPGNMEVTVQIFSYTSSSFLSLTSLLPSVSLGCPGGIFFQLPLGPYNFFTLKISWPSLLAYPILLSFESHHIFSFALIFLPSSLSLPLFPLFSLSSLSSNLHYFLLLFHVDPPSFSSTGKEREWKWGIINECWW